MVIGAGKRVAILTAMSLVSDSDITVLGEAMPLFVGELERMLEDNMLSVWED